MSNPSDDAREVLRLAWSAEDEQRVDVDEDCSPTKTCRNMVGVSLDGFAEPGMDLRTAWQERLRREGKLSAGGGSIRDLVLGKAQAH